MENSSAPCSVLQALAHVHLYMFFLHVILTVASVRTLPVPRLAFASAGLSCQTAGHVAAFALFPNPCFGLSLPKRVRRSVRSRHLSGPGKDGSLTAVCAVQTEFLRGRSVGVLAPVLSDEGQQAGTARRLGQGSRMNGRRSEPRRQAGKKSMTRPGCLACVSDMPQLADGLPEMPVIKNPNGVERTVVLVLSAVPRMAPSQ